MTEQEKREKVIAEMVEVVHDFHEETDEWWQYTTSELSGGISVDCDWFYGVQTKCEDALALLKAQEPGVMTLDEIDEHIIGKPYIIESSEFGDGSGPYIAYGLFFIKQIDGKYRFALVDKHVWLLDEDYGKTWRCWTFQPTDEQREATPWEE